MLSKRFDAPGMLIDGLVRAGSFAQTVIAKAQPVKSSHLFHRIWMLRLAARRMSSYILSLLTKTGSWLSNLVWLTH